MTTNVPSAARLEVMLGELLATIHRDGGHYIEEHGWEKAYEDGMDKYGKLHLSLVANHNYRVFFDTMVNRILGDYGTTAAAEGPIVASEIAVTKCLSAVQTLQEFRAALLMEHRQGQLEDNVPDVQPTAEGMIKAVRDMRRESAASAVLYERARVINWLVGCPSDPILELAFADSVNPYMWLAHAIKEARHAQDLEAL